MSSELTEKPKQNKSNGTMSKGTLGANLRKLLLAWDNLGIKIKVRTIMDYSPGWVAQVIRALSPYTKVASSIPSQSTFKNQSTNECINKWKNKLMPLSFSLPPSLPLSLQKSINKFF